MINIYIYLCMYVYIYTVPYMDAMRMASSSILFLLEDVKHTFSKLGH